MVGPRGPQGSRSVERTWWTRSRGPARREGEHRAEGVAGIPWLLEHLRSLDLSDYVVHNGRGRA